MKPRPCRSCDPIVQRNWVRPPLKADSGSAWDGGAILADVEEIGPLLREHAVEVEAAERGDFTDCETLWESSGSAEEG